MFCVTVQKSAMSGVPAPESVFSFFAGILQIAVAGHRAVAKEFTPPGNIVRRVTVAQFLLQLCNVRLCGSVIAQDPALAAQESIRLGQGCPAWPTSRPW